MHSSLHELKPLPSELEAFRDVVLTGEPGIVTMREGLATCRVAGAVLEAAALETTVDA